MIDEKKTFMLFKYTSVDLSHGSHKKVLMICDECGQERLSKYNAYRDLCASCSHKGDKNPMFKKHHTEETKQKMSKSKQGIYVGKKHPMYGKTAENHPSWKGGKKLATARKHTKRRKLFGFIPHNKPQENFHGHHLDFNHVIFIPKKIHVSIPHSVVHNKNMNLINNIACDWYLNYQLNGI